MSKLNQPTNLRTEDYPDQAAWIGRLFAVLNPFIVSVQSVFDSNVDYSSNIRSVVKDFDTTSLTFPITFQWPFSNYKPSSLSVYAASGANSPTALIPAWSYDSSNSNITISYLTEVSATGAAAVTSGRRYKFSVRATV